MLDVLKEQVGNDPDDLKSRIKLAGLLNTSKKYVQAENVALDALRIDVTDTDAQKTLIDALEGQNKTKQVEEYKKRFGSE